MVPRNTTTAHSTSTGTDQINGPEGGPLNDHNGILTPGSQLDLVLSEVRRLEEMSNRYNLMKDCVNLILIHSSIL